MYTLACADLGVPECHYVSKGDSADAVVSDMRKHADEKHADKIKGMTDKMSAHDVDAAFRAQVKESKA